MIKDDKTRPTPPLRQDGRMWSARHLRGASLCARGVPWPKIAEECAVRVTTARNWVLVAGWSELVAHFRQQLVREEVEGLAAAGAPVLQRLLDLADQGSGAREFLETSREAGDLNPDQYAHRLTHLLKAEGELIRHWLSLSGWSELRSAQVQALTEQQSSALAAPELPVLTHEEEFARATEIARALESLGGVLPDSFDDTSSH